MADDLSLLFKLRADNAQAKTVFQDTAKDSQVLAQRLKQSFGPELAQTVSISNKVFSDLGNHLNLFIGERLPLVGGAFVRVTENLHGLTNEMRRSGPETKKLADQIEGIAKVSGKSSAEIANFLTSFSRLRDPADKNTEAFKFFGGSVDLIGNKTAKFVPQLDEASASLTAVETASTGAGAALGSIAVGAGIALLAIGAVVVAAIELSKEIFELAKSTAEFQGKLVDLSQQTGLSVGTLSALEVAARKTGGTIDGLTQSLVIFQSNLESAAEDPASKAAIALRKLGVDATDTEAALRQTIAALARMPEGFKQTAAARDVFGRGGKAFLALAKETNGDIDEITRRLGGLGLVTTEQAKLAKEFNDKLVDLEFQLRGLGTQAIPVVLDVLKDLSTFLRDNRDIIILLQGVVKGLALAISVPLKFALANLKVGLELAHPALELAAKLLERIKAAVEFIAGHPIHLPGVGTAEPSATAQDGAAAAAKAVEAASAITTKAIQKEIEDRQRLQGLIRFMLADEKRQAEDRIATAQREFAAGHITREQLLQETLLGNRKKAQAEIDELKADRAIKVEQEKLAKDDVEKQRQIGDSIIAIDAQIADKKAALQRGSQDLTAKSQLDERKDQLAHEQATLEILTKGGEDRIARIEAEIRAGVTEREKGLRKIEEIENAALVARGQLLKRELELAGVGPERQAALDKITALENDRTELERKQSARRVQITQEEAAEKVAILLASAEATSRIAEVTDASRIASLKAQAALRLRTEEDTERAILQIRLAAIDREDDLARIRNTAAKAEITARLSAIQDAGRSLEAQLQSAADIQDPTKRVDEQTRIASTLKQNVDEEIAAQGQANKDRDRLDKELNDQLRVNNAERVGIQSQGERDIDDSRQRDLDNERQYNRDLQELRERTQDIQRDTAAEVIRLMRLHFASRRDLIRAQRDLDIDDENSRHQNALDTISALRAENVASNRTREEKLESEKEIDALSEAEAERHRLVLKGIRDQEAREAKEATPLGRLDLGTEELRDFANVLEQSIVPLGQILTNTFQRVADAIGQTVQNWVLLGETGPAVMRKILAQALASIAAEAAVNAIKELALGFASLFFNPAESAAHFISAGLWGSIAGGSALVGRGIAGNLFKPKSTASGGASQSSGQLATTTLGRNQPQVQVVRHEHVLLIKSNDSHIVSVVGANIRKNGELRGVILNDGGV